MDIFLTCQVCCKAIDATVNSYAQLQDSGLVECPTCKTVYKITEITCHLEVVEVGNGGKVDD